MNNSKGLNLIYSFLNIFLVDLSVTMMKNWSKMTDYEKRLKILNELNSSDEFKKEEIIESSNQILI